MRESRPTRFTQVWRRLSLAWLMASLSLLTILPSVNAQLIFPPPGEPELGISIGDASVTEPSSGTVTMTFSVRLTGRIFQSHTINFATTDGSAKAALGDYVAKSGSLTFTPVNNDFQTKFISVVVKADAVAEGNETFFVNLSATGQSASLLNDTQGKGTILAPPGGGGGGDDECEDNPHCQPTPQ